jgi:hypothetical protein
VRDVKKALQIKGFREEKRDHWYYLFYHNGKKTDIYTKISYNQTDISKPLCSAMARQMRLSGNSQFEEFVDCDLTHQKYLQLLIIGKHLEMSESKTKKDETRAKRKK